MPDDKEIKVILSPEAQAQLDADPELAAAFRSMSERLRQVTAEFNAGKFKTMEDAMRSIGAEPHYDPDDD